MSIFPGVNKKGLDKSSSSRDGDITSWPSFLNLSQISLPIPEEAPVIKYFLSIKYVDLLISSINYFVTSFV